MSSPSEFRDYFADNHYTKGEILSYLRGYISSYGRKSSKAELLSLLFDVKLILELSKELPSDLDRFLNEKRG